MPRDAEGPQTQPSACPPAHGRSGEKEVAVMGGITPSPRPGAADSSASPSESTLGCARETSELFHLCWGSLM